MKSKHLNMTTPGAAATAPGAKQRKSIPSAENIIPSVAAGQALDYPVHWVSSKCGVSTTFAKLIAPLAGLMGEAAND